MDFGVFFDAAVGIACLMAVFSIAATAIQEAVAQRLANRPKTLKQGLQALLESGVLATVERRIAEARGMDPDPERIASAQALTIDDLYGSPAIKSLMGAGRLPSAIPPRVFAEAILDLVGKREELAREAAQDVRDRGRRAAETVGEVVEALGHPRGGALPDAVLETAERIASRIEQTRSLLDREIEALELQFNQTMDRVSGWYMRLAQRRLFAIGLVLAAGANIDLLGYVQHLSSHEAARTAAVAFAGRLDGAQQGGAQPQGETQQGETPGVAAAARELQESLVQLKAPIGWACRPPDPTSMLGWEVRTILGKPLCAAARSDTNGAAGSDAREELVLRVPGPATWAGWVLVGFACMLGAQFWFDLLKRIMTFRNTTSPGAGKPPAKVVN